MADLGSKESVDNAQKLYDITKKMSEAVGKGADAAKHMDEGLKAAGGDVTKLLKSFLDVNRQMSKSGGIMAEIAEGSSDWAKYLGDVSNTAGGIGTKFSKMVKDYEGAVSESERHRSALSKVSQILEGHINASKHFAKEQKRIQEEEKKILKTLMSREDSESNLTEAKKIQLDLQEKLAKASDAERGALEEQVALQEDNIKALQSAYEITEATAETALDNLKTLKKETELRKKLSDLGETKGASGMLKGIGSQLGGKQGIKDLFTKGTKEDWAEKAKYFKGLGGAAKGDAFGTGGGKAAASVASGVGGMVSMMGPMISSIVSKLNIAGIIVTAIKSVFDFIAQEDAWKKKYVQAFSDVTTSMFNSKKFRNGSEEFMDNILGNADLNTKTGRSGDDWVGMYKAMSTTGLSIEKVTNNLEDMQKVQKMVSDGSRLLGMSLDDGGKAYADMVASFKTPAEEMKDVWDDIASGAQQAGMRADKFYNVISQSTLALANYGVYIKSATASLASFNKSKVLTQQQSEKATQDSMSLFSGGFEQNMKLLGMAGQGNVDAAWNASLKDKQDKFKGMKTTDPEYEKLKAEIYQMTQIAGKGDGERGALQAQNASFMSDKGLLLLQDILGQFKGAGKSILDVQYMLKGVGVSDDLIESLKKTQSSSLANLEIVANSLTNPSGKTALGALAKNNRISEVLAKGSKASAKDVEDLNGIIDAMGLDDATKAALKQLSNKPIEFQDMLKSIDATMNSKNGPSFALQALADAMTYGSQNPNDILGGSEKASKENAEDLAHALTPLEKTMQIQKDMFRNTFSGAGGPMDKVSELLMQLIGFVSSIEEMISGVFGKSSVMKERERMAAEAEKKQQSAATGVAASAGDASVKGSSSNIAFQAAQAKSIESGGTAPYTTQTPNTGSWQTEASSGLQYFDDGKGGKIYYDGKQLKRKNERGTFGVKSYLTPDEIKSYGFKFAGGTASVPGIDRGIDSVPSMLRPGEMVLNRKHQGNLFRALNGGPSLMSSSSSGSAQSAPVKVAEVTIQVSGVSGEEVAEAIEKRLNNASFWESKHRGL